MIVEVCYCTRDEVKRALDLKATARNTLQIDRAMQSSARSVEKRMKRVFYPTDGTRFIDWPNYQYANPWRAWLKSSELAAPATSILAGTTPIPIGQVFFGPWEPEPGPPFTFFELDRSSTAAFGGNAQTPQRAITVIGTFGFDVNKDQMATLATAITTTTQNPIIVSDSGQIGPGIVIVIDTERMLVQDAAMVQAGTLTLAIGLASSPPSAADNNFTVNGSGTLQINETILIDSERMLIVDINGSNYVVKRGWDGSVLAAHTGGSIVYVQRSLTVQRGALGTTAAAAHALNAPVYRHRVPSLIRDVAIAESEVQLTGEPSAWAGEETAGGSAKSPPAGGGLAGLWARAEAAYRRNTRLWAV
jgi:hypothetical protein